MSIFNYFEGIPQIGPTQQWLLEALVSDAPRNRESLKKWVADVDFDALDYSSFRLIPALFTKFLDDPLCEPYRGRMKGIYRYFQFRTSLLAADARRAVEALTAAGIETLLFKGIAIALKLHGNPALRPMGDVDILVRPKDVASAEKVLQELGWQYRYAEAKKKRDIHSHDYINANKNGFDLHWFALYESPIDGIDEGIWQRAERTEWQGNPVQVMSREDLALIGMINGRREPEARRHEWIYDIALIVRIRPCFDWKLLWQEAGRRQLRHILFDAMLLLNSLVPDVLPTKLLHALVTDDPDLCRRLLRPLIAENRTHALDQSKRTDINSLLESPTTIRYFFRWLLPFRSLYQDWSRDASSPKHIRYTINAEGEIDSLYMHWQYLPLLAKLFDVADRAGLGHLTARYPAQGEGCIVIEPGFLALPDNDILPHYHAQIRITEGQDKLEIPANEVAEIALTVVNDSRHCWYVRAGSPALYGVSYHLYSADGELLQWDQPRTYFMQARSGYLAFVPPGQRLSCRMKIHAPEQPGRYRLKLDVLQETILWFSGQHMRFPEVKLIVIP